MRIKLFSALFIGAFVLGACNKDDNSPQTPDNQDPYNAYRNLNVKEGQTMEVKDLDASDNEKWVYYSFNKGVVDVTNPRTSENWDIAFNRYNIRTNGGTSGIGKAEVIKTESKLFTEVTKAPAEDYTKDTEETPITRPGQTATPISVNKIITGNVGTQTGWWNYTPPAQGSTTPKTEITQWVYVVKTASGDKYVKIQLTAYNHSVKPDQSGFITFKYAYLTEVEQPKPKEKITLSFQDIKEVGFNLKSGANWTYISLAEGKEVTPNDPKTDLTWDIAFNQYYVITNGGVSGAGKAAVASPQGKDFDAVTEAFTDATKYTKDAETEVTTQNGTLKINISPILSGGFGTQTGIIDINPANMNTYGRPNVYAPTNYVYVIKTADGTYAKIQVTDIYEVTDNNGTKTYKFGKFNLKYRLSTNKSE